MVVSAAVWYNVSSAPNVKAVESSLYLYILLSVFLVPHTERLKLLT
jgi:hypothetical protein